MPKRKSRVYPELTKLKGKMTECKYTYRSMSEATGIKLHRLSDVLNGYYQVYLDEALKIAEVLEIEAQEIPIFFALSGA